MKNEIIIYQANDLTKVEVKIKDETVWLTLNQIAQLFGRDKSVISRHLKNIYKDGELAFEATVAKSATVQIEAGRKVTREIDYYNLDAILSVGYRVNSKQGTQFRIWATNVLKEQFAKAHDRFLIIDKKEIYHFGASLKDLGKKWFAFTKLNKNTVSQLLNSISEML